MHRGKAMKLSEKYYSGRDVQRLLGISEPQLRTLVSNKKLKKIIPPGRKTAVYLKSEVEGYAEQWEAFLMAKDPPKTTFKIADLEDMEDEHDLDARAVGPNGMPTELRKTWLEPNPESDYHVYHNNKLVAFMHLVPLKHEIIEGSMQGTISWRDIDPKTAIEKYELGKPIELFVEGIASDPDTSEINRMHYMLVLIRNAGIELKKLGQRGIIVTKVYGKSQTPTGIAMATHAGMMEYLPRKGKMMRFVLDVEHSTTYLARKYKEGFEEWQKEQKRYNKEKRKTKVSLNEKQKVIASSSPENE